VRYDLVVTAVTSLEDSIVFKNRRTFIVAVSLLGCTNLLVSTEAHAQYNYYQSGSFYSNINTYPPIYNNYKKTTSGSTSSGSSTKVKKRTTDRVSTNNNHLLPYTRDRELSSKIREEYLQDIEQRFPSQAAGIRTLLSKNDVVYVTAKFIQREGLDSSTMEGVMAYWFGQAWAVSNQQPFPTAQQYQGIAEQIRQSSGKSSKLSQMTNAQRQTFFEELAYRLFEQRANYQAVRKSSDTASTAKIARETQAGLTKLGLNFKGKRLNDNGFE
jgi:hypothetical protein